MREYADLHQALLCGAMLLSLVLVAKSRVIWWPQYSRKPDCDSLASDRQGTTIVVFECAQVMPLYRVTVSGATGWSGAMELITICMTGAKAIFEEVIGMVVAGVIAMMVARMGWFIVGMVLNQKVGYCVDQRDSERENVFHFERGVF